MAWLDLQQLERGEITFGHRFRGERFQIEGRCHVRPRSIARLRPSRRGCRLLRGGGLRRRVLQNGRQLVGNGLHRRKTFRRFLCHHLQADGLDAFIHFGTQLARAGRLLAQDLAHHDHHRPLERQPAGEQLVENHAEAILVGRRTDLLGIAFDLLGRHERRRADDDARLRQAEIALAAGLPGQAEIHNDRLVPLVDHDVGRLQVAMHDGVVVRLLQGQGQLADHNQDLPLTLLLVGLDKGRKGTPLDVGHRDIVLAVDLADVVDRTDMGVPQSAGCTGLPIKALQRAPVGSSVKWGVLRAICRSS